MGLETRILSPDREKVHPCLREVPLGSLVSSLHSAKDFIVPVFSSCIGRVLVRHHSNTAPSSIVLASVGFSQDFLAHQGSSDACRTVLAKESSSCHGLPPANSGSSDARLSSGFLGICTDDDISGAKKCPNGSPEQHSRFSGLSLQGLPSFPPGFYLIFKQRCCSDKAHESACFDDSASERPSMGADLFQTMMDHCLFAASILSKQAGQVAPLNENFFCAINDSKEKVMEFLHGNLWVNSSVQKNQRVSNVLQRSGSVKKAGQSNSVRPVCLGFAKIGGDFKDVVPSVTNAERPASTSQNGQSSPENEASSPIGTPGLFKVPMPTIERLRSTLSTVSLAELVEFLPQLGKTSQDFPDKKKLFSVQDFFQYTEAEGRRFFEELDRDNDGQVTLEDLEAAMRKRRLPQQYARDFLRRTRKNLFMKSFGWHEFLCLMEQKEAMMLRAYNSLNLSKSGTLQKSQVLTSLHSAGLPATEENVAAMLRCLDPDAKGSIAYGQFRNFMLLLPPERLGDDPRMVWFEAATVVPMAPPVTVPAENVLKSALAGGLACALSTSLMHPIDTIKTRVQASSTLSFPELLSKLPEIGVKGLYRGSIPAILGQFSSHGLRTGIFEASKLLLTSFAPGLAELQVQSMASFCSTVLGTAVRIPCEVLKQRLQAGIFSNVGEAIIGTWQRDGPRGFFRGTGATLCREVPFYVAGMCIYAEAKKAMRRLLNRELEPWETIAVGAVSGGLAAVFTTPFDVMKTRTMTAAPGLSTNMSTIALTILREEGALGLFKGAVPRFFWIAPLGAMNFAGYELAKRAMEKQEQD